MKCVNFAHLLTKVPRYATGNGYHTSYSKKKQRKRIVTKPHRYIVFKRNISLRNILLNLKKNLFLSYTLKIQIKLTWLYKNKRILKANFIAFWNNLLWKITTLFVMFKKKKNWGKNICLADYKVINPWKALKIGFKISNVSKYIKIKPKQTRINKVKNYFIIWTIYFMKPF